MNAVVSTGRGDSQDVILLPGSAIPDHRPGLLPAFETKAQFRSMSAPAPAHDCPKSLLNPPSVPLNRFLSHRPIPETECGCGPAFPSVYWWRVNVGNAAGTFGVVVENLAIHRKQFFSTVLVLPSS